MADTSAQTLAWMKALDKKLTTNEGPAKKAYELALRNMKQAIDNESEDEIQLAQDDVKNASSTVDQCLHACQQLHQYTDALQQDREFLVAHRAEIIKVVTHFGTKQKEMAKWSKELRDLGETARKAESAAKQGTADIEGDLGALKNQAQWVTAEIKKFGTERPKIEKDARGDPTAKVAEQARLKLIDLNKSLEETVRDAKKAVLAFGKDHPDVESSIKREVQTATDEVSRGESLLKDGNALLLELLKLKQTAASQKKPPAAAKPPAPLVVTEADIKKSVAPIVGIDPKDAKAVAEIGKLLKGMPKEKWGEGLGKLAVKYKSKKTDGKAMAAAVLNLPAVKKQLQPAAR